jgi:alkanesulfonate monooxygenase SsuD/methylene tetrahydromethanopterin reductase-like flavin-dependent oxidoreductase (luciferase family)
MQPFRFAVQVSSLPLPGWRERVRWYEQLGFAALHTPDHFDLRQWDPLATQAAVAGATTRAATGATVIDVGFYHPMVLARAAATALRWPPEATSWGSGRDGCRMTTRWPGWSSVVPA